MRYYAMIDIHEGHSTEVLAFSTFDDRQTFIANKHDTHACALSLREAVQFGRRCPGLSVARIHNDDDLHIVIHASGGWNKKGFTAGDIISRNQLPPKGE